MRNRKRMRGGYYGIQKGERASHRIPASTISAPLLDRDGDASNVFIAYDGRSKSSILVLPGHRDDIDPADILEAVGHPDATNPFELARRK